MQGLTNQWWQPVPVADASVHRFAQLKFLWLPHAAPVVGTDAGGMLSAWGLEMGWCAKERLDLCLGGIKPTAVTHHAGANRWHQAAPASGRIHSAWARAAVIPVLAASRVMVASYLSWIANGSRSGRSSSAATQRQRGMSKELRGSLIARGVVFPLILLKQRLR